jgi:hypothetical protein
MRRRSQYSFLWAFACALLAYGPVVFAEESAAANKTEPAKPAATAEEIAGWIKSLDDSRYKEREEATQHLLDAGSAVLDPLLAVANGEQPEPADRAVWIMRRLGRSRESDLALAALGRLVQLKNRPTVVAKAEVDLMERTLAICEQRLGPLGAEINRVAIQFNGLNTMPGLEVKLGEKWRGKSEDLRAIAELDQQQYFRLEGSAINDDVAKMFAEKERLGCLQLQNTKVTPEAVDLVKAKHPNATVYMRNQALLGVSAENHASGVMVVMVQPGSAAANAGIVVGDIVAKIDGHKLPDFDRLTARIAQHQVGDKIDVEVIRQGETIPLKVELGTWPNPE